MLATPLVNIEDYLDPPAFVDVSEELKQESWQLLKLSLRQLTLPLVHSRYYSDRYRVDSL